MKFAAIFLACAVAAQAVTYPSESYEQWCASDFNVFPPCSCYSYNVPFNSQWCTSKYYADCLVEFPKTVGKSSCEESTDHLTCVSSYELKLEAARQTIKTELDAGLKPFTDKLDNIHATYMATLKQYLKRFNHDYCQEREDRIAKYQKKLDAARNTAVTTFTDATTKAIARIKTFHDQIVKQFHNCLATRTTRLSSYNVKMDKRAVEIVAMYQTSLTAVVAKRVAFVKSVLQKIYDGVTKNKSLPVVMFKYECDLENEVTVLISDFRAKVNEAVESLKESYRCNNKCFFTTKGPSFSKKNYARPRVQFPTTPKYSYKLVGLCAFNADWNGAAYKGLRTCTIAEKTSTGDEQIHVDEIDAKVILYKTDLARKLIQWKTQVAEWKQESSEALIKKVTCRVPKTKCGCGPTQAEIDAFHQKLQAQARIWIDLRAQHLLAQVSALEASVSSKIASWSLIGKTRVERVKERLHVCVADRRSKVASYKRYLEDRKNTQRARLQRRLTWLANQHKAQFDRFFHCSFGVNPTEQLFLNLQVDYKSCVDTKVVALLQKYDDFWSLWQPKLVHHYECGFKCTTKVTTPGFNVNYSWRLRAPKVSQCHFF